MVVARLLSSIEKFADTVELADNDLTLREELLVVHVTQPTQQDLADGYSFSESADGLFVFERVQSSLTISYIAICYDERLYLAYLREFVVIYCYILS